MALLQRPKLLYMLTSNFSTGVLIHFLHKFKYTFDGLTWKRLGMDQWFHQRIDNIKLLINVLNQADNLPILVQARVDYF